MDIEHFSSGEEPEILLPDGEAYEDTSSPDLHRMESRDIHPRVVALGKREAQAGELVAADLKPRWLACVFATMCAVEEHGRSEMVETS